MDYATLGRSGLTVSRLALGTAPIGDLYGRIDELAAQATVRAACEGGVTLFDSSPLYGFGLSELRLGAGLRQCGSSLRPVISTKVGRRVPRLDEEFSSAVMPSVFAGGLQHRLVFDYSADGTKRSLEQSLLRLGVDAIDIALIHDVDVSTHGVDGFRTYYREAMDGAYRALDELRGAGVIKAIGVGVNEADPAARFVSDGDFDVVLLAGRYSLLEQPALNEFLPLATRKQVAVMLGGVFNSGILASGAVSQARYDYAPAPPEILDRVARIEAVCRAHGVALRDAAIRFPLAHSAIKTLVIGAISESEVKANIASLDAAIPDQLWRDLKSESLLGPEVPVPAA